VSVTMAPAARRCPSKLLGRGGGAADHWALNKIRSEDSTDKPWTTRTGRLAAHTTIRLQTANERRPLPHPPRR